MDQSCWKIPANVCIIGKIFLSIIIFLEFMFTSTGTKVPGFPGVKNPKICFWGCLTVCISCCSLMGSPSLCLTNFDRNFYTTKCISSLNTTFFQFCTVQGWYFLSQSKCFLFITNINGAGFFLLVFLQISRLQ